MIIRIVAIALALSRPVDLVSIVYSQALRAHANPALEVAKVEWESRFDPRAASANWNAAHTEILSWSRGLHQINDAWYPTFPGDLRMHCYMGSSIMAWCLHVERGDVRRALVRYNVGHWTPAGRAYADGVLGILRSFPEMWK